MGIQLYYPWIFGWLPSGYDIASLPWKDPPIFEFGKPSISMGHLYHGYVTNNQRVSFWILHDAPRQYGDTHIVIEVDFANSKWGL